MEELQIVKYLSQIMKRQEILIDQLSSICTTLAKIYDESIEDSECDEDEFIGIN